MHGPVKGISVSVVIFNRFHRIQTANHSWLDRITKSMESDSPATINVEYLVTNQFEI